MNRATSRRALLAGALVIFVAMLAVRNAEAQQGALEGQAAAALVPVVINEILAHTDPPQVDSVELYNPYGTQAEIGGWCLSDSGDEQCRYRFPAGTQIGPNGFLVITATEWNAGSGRNWGLSEMGESVYLSQALPGEKPAGYQHRARFGASANGVGLGRVVTSDGREFFAALQSLTLGAPNSPPSVGPVVIAEVMYHPSDASLPDYLEVLNTGDTTVRLYDSAFPGNRWRVDGVGKVDPNAPGLYLPPGMELGPGQSLFLTSVAAEAFRVAYGLAPEAAVVPYPGTLKDDGDEVAILRPDTPNQDGTIPYLIVDEVDYTNTYPWPTEAAGQGAGLQRAQLRGFGQEPMNWRASEVGLADTAAIQVLSLADVPRPGGGRLIQWETAWEWRGSAFRVLRSETASITQAQQVGGDVPSRGGRHQGRTYAIGDPDAALDQSWHYWLVWDSAAGESTVAEHVAGLWQSAHLPLVQR